MSNSKRFLPLLLMIMLLTALGLAACGDSATNTPAAAASTTVAATTAAATKAATTAVATTAAATTATTTTTAATAAPTTVAATTAASTTSTTAASTGSSDTLPLYAGATVVTLPDAIKTQLESSVGSSVTNPQVASFATGDAGAKVKSFYSDYLAKNGWTDLTASAGQAASTQIEALGGFFLLYSKGQKVAALIGLPGATASTLGISGTTIPSGGTLVIGFSGDASGAGGSTTATTAASTTATTAAAATTTAATATTAAAAAATSDSTIPLYEGATAVTLPDAIKTQFESSVGSNVANPQVAAFVTKDDGAKVKAFYTDYLTKNGWKDSASAVSGNTGVSQIESAGGFYLVYSKDKQVSVLIGLPSATAAGFGVPAADIPSNGTLVLGFSGSAK